MNNFLLFAFLKAYCDDDLLIDMLVIVEQYDVREVMDYTCIFFFRHAISNSL